MRIDKGYRYTLQFPAYTLEQRQAGEFLERIGSKKSSVVVQAMTDYLRKNPDLLEPGGTIHVTVGARLSREEVRAIIREELARNNPPPLPEIDGAPPDADQEKTIDAMLANIGLFG